jgi:hypothetical protein
MSNRWFYAGRMKLPHNVRRQAGSTVEIIGQFGQATLVRCNGRNELTGGSAADWTATKEWVSLFDHELTVSRGSGKNLSRTEQPVKSHSLCFRFRAGI